MDNSASFPPIHRPSVVQLVIESIQRALIEGSLRPGQRLPAEHDLAQQFGVGRSAIREAMKMLAALGVVTIQQGDGTYIVDEASSALLSPLVFAVLLHTGMSTDLLELRALIETGYCQIASERATPQDWQHIENVEGLWEEYASDNTRDMDLWTHKDLAFHFAVLHATHNPLVIRIGSAVEEMFFASIRSTLSHQEWLGRAVDGHRSIIAAMRAHSPEDIRCAVINSLSLFGLALAEDRPHSAGISPAQNQ